ncbi:uncharacterized protein At4g17910 [Drosophila grimshawi]|uniref:Phosphatidylinositol-glycan biosynthesis class W protein n=1 Tax=Drosophila grimshawi TaxID=7222 RepID=B4IYM7_DROGR|nr:uncharacterized protein At4g17910 [Drosophila grimshawi]EDV95537.1 GH15724 [Drosophila grimshawi]
MASMQASIYELPKHATEKRSLESIEQSFASLFVILTTFSGIILARVVIQRLKQSLTVNYLLEFPLIVLPTVLFVTVANGYSGQFVGLMIVLSFWFILRTRALSRAKCRAHFDLGSRVHALTIVRALTHLITAVCILAIDFKSFHRPYRKSRLFGAQLMDTGIGLFVVTMGLVSRRSRNSNDLRRSLLRSALPLILLGIARVVAIVTIGYGQDEHEYGQHLNAFFTLGFTKLMGSVLSLVARSDTQLLPLAIVVIVTHQLSLSVGGISDYVMDDDLPRSTLFSANREGLLSLPGFVAIYLLSICLNRWLVSKTLLTYGEIIAKLRGLLIMALNCWGFTMASALTVGISRVTCNLGYIFWMFAIMSTMVGLSIFIFDLIINNNSAADEGDRLEQGSTVAIMAEPSPEGSRGLHVICESLNLNGLTFFLLANVSTGCVNIFLKPEDRSDPASVVILTAYMFLVTFAAFLLYERRIRIA